MASTARPRVTGLALDSLWEASDVAGTGGARDGDVVAPAGARRGDVAGSRSAADLAGPSGVRGGELPPALRDRFPGALPIPLRSDGPVVVANFVESLDGIVALSPEEGSSGGGEISGFSEADRFMMALLRGLADVVVVGAGTVRAGSGHEWTPRGVQRPLAGIFDAWRGELGLAPQPTTIVVTARGDVDPQHAGLRAPDVPVVIATTSAGARRLERAGFTANVRIEAVGDAEDVVPPARVVELARSLGARVALCEGGPHLFGEFLSTGLVDELFLTLAPQLLGRVPERRRLALVEGTRLADDGRSRWSRLVSVRLAGDDLFLRYRFDAAS